MRRFALLLLPLSILPGCRGYLADHVRPEASIMVPEFSRYGFSAAQSQCFGDRLAATLSVWQLRQLANVTRLIKEPARLTPGELVRVSNHVRDKAVPQQVQQAGDACGVGAATSVARAAEPEPPAATASGTATTPAPPAVSAAPAPVPGTATPAENRPAPQTTSAAAKWLNLGSGIDKQSISIDASTLEGEKPLRRAWFRILAAGATSSNNSYLLQIDCTAKSVYPLASRKHDGQGAVTEEVKHGPAGAGANAIQSGSVIEIAYLSLCT